MSFIRFIEPSLPAFRGNECWKLKINLNEIVGKTKENPYDPRRNEKQ